MVLDFLDSDGNTLWRHQVKQKGYRVPLVRLLTKLSEKLRYPFRVWLVIKEIPTIQPYPTTNTTFCSRYSMYGFRPEQLFNNAAQQHGYNKKNRNHPFLRIAGQNQLFQQCSWCSFNRISHVCYCWIRLVFPHLVLHCFAPFDYWCIFEFPPVHII